MPLLRWVFGTLLIFSPASTCAGQALSSSPSSAASAILSGSVVDPSGARIPRASIHIHGDSLDTDLISSVTGVFETTLPLGSYTLTINAPGFRTLTSETIILRAGDRLDLMFPLAIAARPEEVSADPFAAGANPADSRNSISFSGSQLQVLSDDPTTLREELLAMAGAGAGPGGAQFYIDGFSNGQLPPKSAIRSIRINNNPYSAIFDQASFGRIDVETRAGGNKLHGTFNISGTDAALNADNPYTGAQPPYYQLFFSGNLSGPVTRKTTFFLAGNSTDLQNNAVVNAVDPDAPSGTISEAVPNPQRDDDYSLRLDRQISASNTLNGRYEIHSTRLTNGGVGLLVLPSAGYAGNTLVQTLQLDDNDILSPRIVNDARFQYIRTRARQDPNDTSPAIVLEGSFSAGGSPTQTLRDNQDRYELADDLSIDHGKQFLRTGGRYRLYRESSYSNAGFNGQFTFANLAGYQSGKPSQFNLTVGQPGSAVYTGDLGLYFDDAWKLARTFTLSLGLRYETQSALPTHNNFAPRVAFVWAVGSRKAKAPLLTLRGGIGLFYNRFAVTDLLTTVRQNGTTQIAYFVQNPSFYPNIPPPSDLGPVQPTTYRLDPHLHTAYDLMTSITAERTIGKIGSISANFLEGHGVHQYLSINANAPLPGTYDPNDPSSGDRPFGGTQNIYQFTSEGSNYGHIFFSNFTLHPQARLFLWGFYVNEHNYGDANSSTAFASNSYNIKQDYGPEDNSSTQQLFCGFNWSLPYGLSVTPFLSARSGRAFNITTGTDLNGDTIYNDRPSFATDLSRPSVVRTALGNFDTDPLPSQRLVPYNYGRAPGLVWLDLQASENLHVGPRPRAAAKAPALSSAPLASPGNTAKSAPPPERPWTLGFSLEVQNLFNHNNPGPPVGVVTSPFFDRSLSLATDFGSLTAANRVVMLRSTFSF